MRKMMMTLMVAGMMLVSGNALAAAYGPAGCGLGHKVMGSDPGIMQIFAVTTNGFLGNQIFGILSGTLGCGGEATVDVGATKNFIEGNREALATDIAQGNGDTIANLASVAGCSDVSLVGQTLQADYSTIFSSDQLTDTNVSENVIQSLRNAPELQCSALGA